ncbi:MAG: EamA family transporter, partial [Candidatus Binatia bacterium]
MTTSAARSEVAGGGVALRGAFCGIAAAGLFGLSAPVAKLLLPESGPLMLAGLLYLGAGVALSLVLSARHGESPGEAPLTWSDAPLLGTIVATGGVLGPVLMLVGLTRVSGVAGSLLLNLEAPFTILVAVGVFREHLGRRERLGVAVIVVGSVLLGWRSGSVTGNGIGVFALAAACACWAVDNNLTQRLSVRDPVALVRFKTLASGVTNLLLALAAGAKLPALTVILPALLLGAASYGLSIVLDTYALRLVGAAREAAYFATAPFFGALAAVPLLGESVAALELTVGGVMACGVGILLRARHGHRHQHDVVMHEHSHAHDEHHAHTHAVPVASGELHSHLHT